VVCTEAETFGKPRGSGDAFSRHVVKNSNKHDDRQEANRKHRNQQQRNGRFWLFSCGSFGCLKHTLITATSYIHTEFPLKLHYHITSHGVDGRRPEGLYIRKIHCNTLIYTLITVCTVVRNCCKGDSPCQWNTPIFRPSEIRNP